jgi:hypothetical protein
MSLHLTSITLNGEKLITQCFRNFILLLLLFTAIGFSPGGSSPYTSTHNTNGHIIYIKVTIQNKLYTITKQNTYIEYKYTH